MLVATWIDECADLAREERAMQTSTITWPTVGVDLGEPLPLDVWKPTGNRHERRAQAARERHVLALLARIQRRQAQRAARAVARAEVRK